MSTFSLELEFDTNSAEFVRGVEIGRLWEQIKDPEQFEQTIHSSNIEMVMRIAEATGREMRVEDIDDNWCFLYVGEVNEL
jgi:hypothetical protein